MRSMTERDFRPLSPAIAGALPKGEPLREKIGRGRRPRRPAKQPPTAKHTASHMVSLLTRRGAHCASAHHGAILVCGRPMVAPTGM